MQSLHESGAEAGLSQRQVDGHMLAVRSGQITRSEYIDITGVSPVTASRDLAKLVEIELLVPEGKTRSRVYRPRERPSDQAQPEEAQLPLLSEDGS